jgi:3-isopropylmalate/(R)-2-methylmalate dehydratase large subunit
MTNQHRTLFDKVWDSHVVADLGAGNALLHIDRILIHDLGGPSLFHTMKQRGLSIRNPDTVFCTPDHLISTLPGRDSATNTAGAEIVAEFQRNTASAGIRYFEPGTAGHGISHIIAPEQAITLPGITMICPDSHTCTHGGLGAIGFGVGASELLHALVTQCMRQKKPKTMRVTFSGKLADGVLPKDMILHLAGLLGSSGANGYALEYAGEAIRGLGIEGRLTICNLSIEMGAKIGMIAPDDTAFEYLQGRIFAPQGQLWDRAITHWRTLYSDEQANFDKDITIDASAIAPQITWGVSPEHTISIDETVPDPSLETDAAKRDGMTAALDYMNLRSGQQLDGLPVDWVFIGSCTNARLSDLRLAATLIGGRKVAAHVTAWVVPGSQAVKNAAEAEGLDKVFANAGFQWREPGCSLCVAANGETVEPGQRAVSTSNRNFVGRQGPGARTHLASPAMAAAAALAGKIVDARKF